MMRKKNNQNALAALALVVIALTAVNMIIFLSTPPVVVGECPEELPEIPIVRYVPISPPDLEGYVPVEIETVPGIIYLTHNCSEMTMVTTEHQTYSIENGIMGVIDPRPTTHDVLKDILDNWEINVTMAKIERMVEGTYYSTLVLEQEDRVLLLDTRPSDSIATAIRYSAPVYINQDILDREAIDIC